MAQVLEPEPDVMTATDLVARFGPIPLHRIRTVPPPGTATEADVLEIQTREKRACELIDGILVEKTVGALESYLAIRIGHFISSFLENENLGIVLGADGMLRFAPGLIRIPDVSFLSWDHFPERKFPDEAVWGLVPDLAVEIISRGNTVEEMQHKLRDYFEAGVKLVWYVYPQTRKVHIHTSLEQSTVVDESETLDGGTVLPGFSLPLAKLFAMPQPPRD
jgi:Uma2 family endonuclease